MSNNVLKPEYLGDGVYATDDGYAVTLTTGSHVPADAQNTIVCEPEVLLALDHYLTRLRKFRTNGTPE
jgi:hypothetical protein